MKKSDLSPQAAKRRAEADGLGQQIIYPGGKPVVPSDVLTTAKRLFGEKAFVTYQRGFGYVVGFDYALCESHKTATSAGDTLDMLAIPGVLIPVRYNDWNGIRMWLVRHEAEQQVLVAA